MVSQIFPIFYGVKLAMLWCFWGVGTGNLKQKQFAVIFLVTSDDGIRFSYVVLVFGFLGIERVGCRNSCLFALVSLMTSNQAVINQSSLWTLTAVQRINH